MEFDKFINESMEKGATEFLIDKTKYNDSFYSKVVYAVRGNLLFGAASEIESKVYSCPKNFYRTGREFHKIEV